MNAERPRWSGLAPAVDAHLARWAQIRDARPLALRIIETRGQTTAFRQGWANRRLRRWLRFGASYGVTGPDGQPLYTMAVLDKDGNERHVLGRMADDPQARLESSVDGQTITGREQFQGDRLAIQQGAILAEREWQMLEAATSHYVSEAVVREVTAAAEAVEPEPLWPTDLFTPSGFAVLETPFLVPDLDPDSGEVREDLRVAIRAIGWHRHDGIVNLAAQDVREGVTLFLYTTPEDSRDYYERDYRAAFPDRDLDPWDAEEARAEGPFYPVEVVPWAFGIDWQTRQEVQTWSPGTVPSPVAFQRRWFMAFQRLCWQQIVVTHRDDRIPRQTRRHWDRMAQRKPMLDYTVLRLRREVDPAGWQRETGTGRPLDHRVLVRAHWRRVHVKSEGPARLPDGSMDPATHRLVWVERHWRGPEEGPIGAMHSATSVVR